MAAKRGFALAIALLLALNAGAYAFETRRELRDAFSAIELPGTESPYAEEPGVRAPYSPGALSGEAKQTALAYANFLRAVAGLDPVQESALCDLRSQHGAVLLAANDFIDHDPPRPDDMPEDFYESAHAGTSESNLVKFNWMRPTILIEGIQYFARDDGEANLAVLGHRRWLLNPEMGETGFGLANSESGMTYVAMYALDQTTECDWSEVLWPSAGAFPVELMHSQLAWSISLNPEKYDIARSNPVVTLREENSGLAFTFDCRNETSDGFCRVSEEAFGAGACIIFRPDFSNTDFTDYRQNQRWTVRVTGLQGVQETLEYAVDMTSLYVQDVANVEMSANRAELRAGETLALQARVIPDYADDLALSWSSSDESVARVDAEGNVTAIAPGKCEIRAESANGRADFCEIIVS
ncbi:MAG: Ig-like domain-containing protein [Candidatus Faecivicinus sp.]|nr:Ig-like domain-containing protein [Candidatus Faecivicinus sp.]